LSGSRVFSKGLHREIDFDIGCGHTDHYEAVGKCVDGEGIYCNYCGAIFVDPSRPADYSNIADNTAFYEMLKYECCPCPMCKDRNDRIRHDRDNKIRASVKGR